MLLIDVTYEQLRQADVTEIYYIPPTVGQTDFFEIYAISRGGVVFRLQAEAAPETFAQDFRKAIQTSGFTV